MKPTLLTLAGVAIAAVATRPASAATATAGLQGQLPAGYAVLANVQMTAGQPSRHFTVVALGQKSKDKAWSGPGDAPDRPLLIFEASGDRYRLVGRNDTVVLRADQGGQCDPFLDGDATIAVKGSYFTVENGVACGQHWTDYITFRFDNRTANFVFDNERTESWSMNMSTAPDADALVRDGRQHVRRDGPGHATTFAGWRPTP